MTGISILLMSPIFDRTARWTEVDTTSQKRLQASRLSGNTEIVITENWALLSTLDTMCYSFKLEFYSVGSLKQSWLLQAGLLKARVN